MIFDNLKNRENYRHDPLLAQALDYLASLKPGTIPDQTHVLSEGILFCNPVSFTSKPEAACRYEAHQTYIDLHYIVEGVEGIATASCQSLTVTEPYDAEKDILFLTGQEDGRYYLKPGQFMVCYPDDAHKVGMMADAPAPIRKIVFKIKASDNPCMMPRNCL